MAQTCVSLCKQQEKFLFSETEKYSCLKVSGDTSFAISILALIVTFFIMLSIKTTMAIQINACDYDYD